MLATVATACPGRIRSTTDWAAPTDTCRSGLMPMVRIRRSLTPVSVAARRWLQPAAAFALWTRASRNGQTLNHTEEPRPMTIIDSQVHAYEANTPKRPWHSVPNWPDHVTGDEMVAAMDKVGVDGAIFISAFSMYRYDASYAVEVQRAHPGRFGLAKPVDPDNPDVADLIA